MGQAVSITWTIEATQEVQLAFLGTPFDNKLIIRQWNSPTFVLDALVYTGESIRSGSTGPPPILGSAKLGVYEWNFGWLLANPTLKEVSGSLTSLSFAPPLSAPLTGPNNTNPTITGTWSFTFGTSPTVVPKSVPLKPAIVIPKNLHVNTGTAPPPKNHYRITALHVLVNRQEPDDGSKLHGRVNEMFFTSYALVYDRRNLSSISNGPLLRTPIHGDTNNSDPVKGVRINSGTVSSSGGIQTGDDIRIWIIDGVSAFLPWEGDLSNGVEAVVLRPMIWVVGGSDQPFYTPYNNRISFYEYAADITALPEVASALANSSGISVDVASELTTKGTYSVHTDRPVGLVVTSQSPTGGLLSSTSAESEPSVWSDQIIVFTREKLEAFLAGQSARTLEVHVKGTWTQKEWQPMGDCTLFLGIERR